VTTQHFAQTLLCAPFALAAGLWIYAFSLCGRTGRMWLTAGLYLIFEAREGRHVLYEDEPVTIRDQRSEEEKMAAYAAMRAETEMLPITPSAAPYMTWTAALHPSDLDELRERLDAVQRDFMTGFAVRIDAVVEEFLRERTDELAIVR
jgi:hypothetical protein